jgi:hypothetical protein
MLAIGQTVQDYGWSLEIDHILGRLNSGAAFDFELIPQKHDELTIFYKDKWGSENRQRFFYSDGEWVDYKSPSVDTIIEQRIFKKGAIDY